MRGALLMERQDIILDPEEEKVYQEIHHLTFNESRWGLVNNPSPCEGQGIQTIQEPGKGAKN